MPVFQGTRKDPYQGFKYRVVIDGFVHAGFRKVTGLKEETEISEYREGTDPVTMNKLPGLTGYDNIVCDRGKAAHDDLYQWRRDIVRIEESGNLGPDGLPPPDFRRQVIIEVYDKGGNLAKAWEIFHAWPAIYEAADAIDAGSSDPMIETMELANEGWIELQGSAPAAQSGGVASGAYGSSSLGG